MKKITIVLTVLLLSLVTINLSATNVSGLISINTKWTLANSPYIVTGNILVSNGMTLTIEPGVTVKFNSGLSMQIDGELIAQGTSSDSITFTSNTLDSAGAWGYIYFSNTSSDAIFQTNIYGNYIGGSILEYCKIKYAGGANVTNNGALRLDGAHPFVNYCTIEFNSASGITAYNLTDSLKISNSLIIHNTNNNGSGGGIYEDGSGVHLISANTISHNSASSGGGIYIAYGGSANTIITNNIVSNNRATLVGGGISCGDGANIANNIIMNNSTLNDDGGGIGITPYTYSNIFKNIIINNTSGRNGGGIEDGAGSNSSFNVIADNIAIGKGGGILNNGIYHNGIEMYNHIVRNTSANDAGMYSSSGDGNIKYNTVAYNINKDFNDILNSSIRIMYNPIVENNNIFGNSAFYEIYNENAQGTNNLVATNNWWGTAVDTTIKADIYDWFDNNTLGIVNYSPFLITPDTLAPVSPPANISKTNIGGGQVKITWEKNPESDIAGYHVYYGGFTGYSFSNMINVVGKADTSYTLTGVHITDTIAVTAYDRISSPANENYATITNDNMTNGNESWYAYAKAPCNSITLTMSAVDASCATCNDGKATATVSLGLSPYTYSWNTSPAQNSSTAINLLPGTYIVTITDGNSCSLIDSAAVSFPNSIKETKSATIAIYPNPASDIVSLNISNINNTDLTLNIYNMAGELVRSEILRQNQQQINIEEISNGIYMVEIKSKGWSEKQKLIIQR